MKNLARWINQIHRGDCRDLMYDMAGDDIRVDMVVTSPPYWGLRSYLPDGHPDRPLMIGLEPTLAEWVDTMTDVFNGVHCLLKDTGTLWLNLGDAHASDGKWGGETGGMHMYIPEEDRKRIGRSKRRSGLKPKNLMGQPWRVAFRMQDAGWFLRSDIIWAKRNPMPGSYRDRPTSSHEHIFLFAKQERYYYDAAAIAEPCSGDSHERRRRDKVAGWATGEGKKHTPKDHARAEMAGGRPDKTANRPGRKYKNNGVGFGHGYDPKPKSRVKGANMEDVLNEQPLTRNMRDVWTLTSEPYPGSHFATFPRELVRRAVLAGSRPGDIVFDPFMGSGTVAEVATSLGRRFIGCELSGDYIRLANDRKTTIGLPL